MKTTDRPKKSAGTFRLTLGKYSGKALSEIATTDPGYLVWLFRKTSSGLVERMIAAFLISSLRGQDSHRQPRRNEYKTAGDGLLFDFDEPGPASAVEPTIPSTTSTQSETPDEVPRVRDCNGLRRLDDDQVKRVARGPASPLVRCEDCDANHVVPPWLDVAEWVSTRLVREHLARARRTGSSTLPRPRV